MALAAVAAAAARQATWAVYEYRKNEFAPVDATGEALLNVTALEATKVRAKARRHAAQAADWQGSQTTPCSQAPAPCLRQQHQ